MFLLLVTGNRNNISFLLTSAHIRFVLFSEPLKAEISKAIRNALQHKHDTKHKITSIQLILHANTVPIMQAILNYSY